MSTLENNRTGRESPKGKRKYSIDKKREIDTKDNHSESQKIDMIKQKSKEKIERKKENLDMVKQKK